MKCYYNDKICFTYLYLILMFRMEKDTQGILFSWILCSLKPKIQL